MVESPQTPETQEDPKSEFIAKLERLWDRGNFVCVGLDSDWELIPQHLKNLGRREGQFRFNKEIIDSTHELVCAYKPNIAFYASEGTRGLEHLKKTIDYIKKNYPQIPIVLDAKRGDIGNTNEAYAKAIFDDLQADAVTVHPYLGKESLEPFLKRADKGIFILVRTSNPGAGEFQDLKTGDKPLYQVVAQHVKDWDTNNNLAVVVGATYPEELKKVREIVGDMPILVPGIGAQGGDLKAVLNNGLDTKKQGLIISVSRAILNAEDPKKTAGELHNQIKEIIQNV